MDQLRQFIKKHDKAVVVVAILGTIIWGTLKGERSATSEIADDQYFTVDDGATLFKDVSTKCPPFEVNGKEAYRAHTGLQSDGSRRVFFVERFTPAAHEVAARAAVGKPLRYGEAYLLDSGREFKAVGDAKWRAFKNDADYKKWVRAMKGTDGKPPYGLN